MTLLATLKDKFLQHPLITTGFDSRQQTPLSGSDADEKSDMLVFINSEERDKLVSMVEVFTDITDINKSSLFAEDIFEEGLLIRYLPSGVKEDEKVDENAVDDDVLSPEAKSPEAKSPKAKSPEAKSPEAKSPEAKSPEAKSLKIENPEINSSEIKAIKHNPASKTLFIPFRTRQFDAYRRLYYLAVEGQLRQGKLEAVSAPVQDKQHFMVSATEFITPNMMRIHIQSDSPLPANDPGYAYRFALTVSNKNNIALRQWPFKIWHVLEPKITPLPFAPKAIHSAKKYGYLAGLELLKRRPAKQPNKVKPVGIIEKRYYTLRQLQQINDSGDGNSTQSDKRFTGEVDVYIHDDTPGSVWATSLQVGDEIHTDHHYHETIKEMTIGQPLFVCDETSIPTVAAMLERWQHAHVPIVIQITNDDAERSYFDEVISSPMLPVTLQDKLTIHHINTGKVDNVAQRVIDIIEAQNVVIDCAWGAIGSKDYRAIKKYLKEAHGLKGRRNRVRAYWVAE